MFSKKNAMKQKIEKMEPQKQRFSIRKFTIGAASVLIGLTFFGMEGQSVHADTLSKSQVAQTENNTAKTDSKADVKVDGNKVVVTGQPTQKAANTNQAAKQPTQKAATTTQQAAKQPAQQAVSTNQAAKQPTQKAATATQQAAKQPVQQAVNANQQATQQPTQKATSQSEKAVTQQPTQKAAALTQKDKVAQQSQSLAQKPATQTAAQSSSEVQATHVKTENDLQAALNNTQVTNIVLDNDIISNNSNYFNLNNGTARQVTISGDNGSGKNASWDAGSNYIWLGQGTENNNQQWDITYKDINIASSNQQGYSPISFGDNVTGTVNFENVTNGGNGVLLYAPKANVNISNTTSSPVGNSTDPNITANNVNVGDNVTLNTTSTPYQQGDIYASGDVIVSGKNVKLTAKGTDGSLTNPVTNIRAGRNVVFKTGADVELSGSNAKNEYITNLFTRGTLDIQEGAKVVINTDVQAMNLPTPTDQGGFNSYDFPHGRASINLYNYGAKIDGDLTINESAPAGSSGVIAGIAVQGNPNNMADVIIGSKGSYTINSTGSRDTRGIFFSADNHTLGLKEGAKATFNMGHGVSNAVFRADNIILKPKASINITTYQDNNGNANNGIQADGAGDHSGPIVVGWNPQTGTPDKSDFVTNNTHATIDIEGGSNLTIIRKVDGTSKQANSPLIVYGSNGGNPFNMYLTMNNGTLDLEDALQMDSNTGTPHDTVKYSQYLGSRQNVFPIGMIAMYALASNNYVQITNPQLFKMERTGYQKGMFFRLEGGKNEISITSNNGTPIPLDYDSIAGVKYTNGNVSTANHYHWDVTSINTVNKWGNWSCNFNNKNALTSVAPSSSSKGISFGEADASVSFAPQVASVDGNSGMSTPYDFNNYFNWWGGSKIALGSKLIKDADKYNPKGGTITVNENATLTPEDAANAITNKSELGGNPTYSWDKDATPSTAKPGTFDGKVVVTYDDKSSSVVAVKVIVRSLAEEYTPVGQDIHVKQYQPAKAIDGIKNTADMPKGTEYTWKEAPDTSIVGSQIATVVVTFPDKSTKDVPVNVFVTGTTDKKSDAEQYVPVGQDIHVKKGEPVKAIDGIKNTADMPKGTQYTWKTTPDTSKVGTQPAIVIVTYPDKSRNDVSIKVIVTDSTKPAEKTDAEKYEPVAQPVTVDKGAVAKAIDGIKNTSDMPKGTDYTWKTTPDTSKVGTQPATVIVTYPDGSKDEVPTTVIVKDENKPVNPDKPVNPAQPVNPEPETPTTPTDTNNTTPQTKVIEPTDINDPAQKDLFKTVTRVITIKKPGEKTQTITQTANFTRNKTINVATGEVVSYGNWTPAEKTFDSVDVPEIDGYTANVDGNVDEVEVTADSDDMTATVTYTRDEKKHESEKTEKTEKHEEPSAEKKSSATMSGKTHAKVSEVGYNYNNSPKSEAGYNYNNTPKSTVLPGWLKGNTPQTIAWLRSHGYQVTVGPNGEIVKITKTMGGKTYTYEIGKNGQLVATAVSGNKTSAKTLPQTGSKDASVAASVGLAVAAAGTMLGLAADRKRKEDK